MTNTLSELNELIAQKEQLLAAEHIAEAKAEQLRVGKLSAEKAAKEQAAQVVARQGRIQELFDRYRPLLPGSACSDELLRLLVAVILSIPREAITPSMVFMPPEARNLVGDYFEAAGKMEG